MKNIIMLLLLSLLVFSCSDELTHSKAKKIINECLKKEPIYGKYKVDIGDNVVLTQKEMKGVKRLVEKGIIKYSKKGYSENIELTDKAENILLGKEEKRLVYNYKKHIQASLKTCEYKLAEVLEIQEIPSLNEAIIKVKFEKISKTEIYELDDNKSDFLTKKITFRKTSNGWRLCE